MKLNLMTFFVFTMLTLPIHAIALNGQDIYESCQKDIQVGNNTKQAAPLDSMQAGACMGYLKGVDDTQLFYTAIMTNFTKDFNQAKKYLLYCLPDELSSTDLAKAIVNYGKNNAADLEKPAIVLVLKALQKSYPCK